MKIELYMSMAANGLMLTADPAYPMPDVVMMDFISRAKAAGAMILGRVTYEQALRLGAGAALGGVRIVVITQQGGDVPGAETAPSPAAAVARLSERQQPRALLAGGAATYSAFLDESLVDEVTLNVLPVITSAGSAITGSRVPQGLTLIESSQLPGGIPQLKFRR